MPLKARETAVIEPEEPMDTLAITNDLRLLLPKETFQRSLAPNDAWQQDVLWNPDFDKELAKVLAQKAAPQTKDLVSRHSLTKFSTREDLSKKSDTDSVELVCIPA